MVVIEGMLFWKNAIPHVKTNIIEVLIAVAKLLSTFFIPIFANIEVSAAKTAENIAAMYQGMETL